MMSEQECKELINAELAIAERYIEKLESNNENLRAELAACRKLLNETLRPGAYGIGSTLAQRISDAIDAAREGK